VFVLFEFLLLPCANKDMTMMIIIATITCLLDVQWPSLQYQDYDHTLINYDNYIELVSQFIEHFGSDLTFELLTSSCMLCIPWETIGTSSLVFLSILAVDL